MQHLYIKTCFINEKLYTTHNIVSASFSDFLCKLAKNQESPVDILCEELPISEILTELYDYDIKKDYSNALFTFYPFPTDMIQQNTIHLTIGTKEDKTTFIHQISFIYHNIIYRFGISI